MKRCGNCKRQKDNNEFYKNKRNKDGLDWLCKQCSHTISRRWQKANVKKRRLMLLVRQHSMTEEQYNNLLKSQNNVCAICGKPERRKRDGRVVFLSVDHNHKTGKNRGLLCTSCNSRLAILENQRFCEQASAYLLKFPD